jgi:glutamyl-tRNA reductase
LAAARDEELSRLSAADREQFQAFADAIVARMLHEPMRRLKGEPDPARKLDRVEAVRHLFKLDE